ncbi:hypothetical protein M9458_020012, partial [Cirrhinus mrigala]
MPPKTIKPAQHSKPSGQMEEEGKSEDNTATNGDITDTMDAINGIKSDLLSQAQRMGAAEERISQAEEE